MGKYAVSKTVVEGRTAYHLLDSSRKMDFGIVPEVGNLGYEFKMNGKDVLIPLDSFKSYLERHKFCCGIPFLEPWANRIDHDYYYFQGKKYLLNASLGNLMRDQFGQPIHGLLGFDARWQVAKTGASDREGAFITSRLDFYKYPDLMAQFPFAHFVEITYRLKDGKLENTTEIHADTAMPILLAYHPYFRPDGPRENWRVSIGARKHWLPSSQLISTGETEPTEKLLPGAVEFELGKTFIDDVFSDFDRHEDGLGHLWVKGAAQKVELAYSQEFDFAVVYAPLPPLGPLICFEPQTGPTNAFNLNHDGKFSGLVVLDAGKVFKGKFWIIPTGF